MDIDLLKSAAEDQMEMMLMMQMDKLSEFSGSYSDGSEMPMMDFNAQDGSGNSNNNNNNNNNTAATMAQAMNNSSTFLNRPSSISFSSFPQGHQDLCPLPFLSSAKWRNACGELAAGGASTFGSDSQKHNSVAAMREMIFRIAAMQPIHIDPESVKPPKRRNVKISKDPQSVAARHRRERISERIRILQRLVPGGTKMDTASMLDEAIHYVKFLKNQVQSLERAAANRPIVTAGIGFPVPMSSGTYLPMAATATKGYQTQNIQHYADA